MSFRIDLPQPSSGSASAAVTPREHHDVLPPSYGVLYSEWFSGGPDQGYEDLEFCVRVWPAKHGSPARHELFAWCNLDCASSGAPSNFSPATGSMRRPALLWDTWDSVAFEWAPPAVLPHTNGHHEIDKKNRCIVSYFALASTGSKWQLKLTWLCDPKFGRVVVPRGLHVQVQIHDGMRIQHPNGNCFRFPLRGELVAADEEGYPLTKGVTVGKGCSDTKGVSDDAMTKSCADPEDKLAELQEVRNEIARNRSQWRQLEKKISERDHSIEEFQHRLSQRPSPEELAVITNRLEEEISFRRKCQEDLMNLRGRIRIFCRIRGLRPEEEVENAPIAVTRVSRTEVTLPALGRSFEFDLTFGPEAQTSAIWDEIWPLVDSVFEQPGMHACVMAYGQTGAGKTFTMEGSAQQSGLIPNTVDRLFSHARKMSSMPNTGGEWHPPVKILVSMLEIYQEQLYDLLRPGDADMCRKLTLRNDSGDAGPEVKGLDIKHPSSCGEALEWYESGMKLRRLGTSERNARSSRSHTVFTLYVERCDPGSGEVVSVSKFSLVDLAGSERQSSASALDRTRVNDAKFINQSLTSLGKVVQACIVRASKRQADGVATHVPYRDSVLTRLLSDSIGGQAKTLLIAHVTPHEQDLPESQCTLQFATNAACVQERIATKTEMDRCRKQLQRLSMDNARLRAELHSLALARSSHMVQEEVCSQQPVAKAVDGDARSNSPLPTKAAETTGTPKSGEVLSPKSKESHHRGQVQSPRGAAKENSNLENHLRQARFVPVMTGRQVQR
eukprot:gnl/TRDRNA2_/TRDRNA2_35194_c0_seq2.p1 gnl/TRDRNA2_/TRDRNA2_35194_c0~~gnl/TRDRNA2_/TRDRNA2_35194_c0_seq2.p1  ORF type:complete len:783 (-),score=133.00 gnl/TRDRNA2_/TRDRNA2_35194_c0_seq2:60-2408(-)